MPMTLWEDIAGHKCDRCGDDATHFWAGLAICCECHGLYAREIERDTPAQQVTSEPATPMDIDFEIEMDEELKRDLELLK